MNPQRNSENNCLSYYKISVLIMAVLDWTLRDLFDRSFKQKCPSAKSTTISIDIPEFASDQSLSAQPDMWASQNDVKTAVYDASLNGAASNMPITANNVRFGVVQRWHALASRFRLEIWFA
jgi:hypothetical protein